MPGDDGSDPSDKGLPDPLPTSAAPAAAPGATAPAPAPEEDGEGDDWNLLTAISNELIHVPEQREPLDKSLASGDLEGLESHNSLDVAAAASGLSSLPSGPCIEEDGVRRRGSTFTASAHIITAVIGAGVLSLPYSMASLGWIGGPICFILFAVITLYTAQLLADLYIIDGKRQRTYTEMVATVYGRKGEISIAIVQQFNLVLTALAYTITAATSMRELANAACGEEKVADGDCFNKQWVMAALFGAVQLVLSFTPNLENFAWASIIGAAMSFGYSILALILSWVYFDTKGTISGMELDTTAETVWNVLNAIGAVLFAYSFSFILLEIQDTIHTPKGSRHGPIPRMKLAVNVCVSIMTVFYMSIAVFGYLSQGNNVQPYLLSGYPDAPGWVLDLANAMVLIHMIPAYQLWSQPHFEWLEHVVASKPGWPHALRPSVLRWFYRPLYVVLVTFLAILMPFFGIILGLVGALGFWPATVLFPIICWKKVFKPKRKMRLFLDCLNWFCAAVTLATIIASVEAIIANASSMTLFGD